MYDSLAAPVVAMALRLSGNERVIEKNLHPLTVWPMSAADFSSFGSEESPRSPAEKLTLAEIQRNLIDAIDEDVVLVPDNTTVRPSKMDWGAEAMEAALAMVELLREAVSDVSGLPKSFTSGDGGEVPSGVGMGPDPAGPVRTDPPGQGPAPRSRRGADRALRLAVRLRAHRYEHCGRRARHGASWRR